MIVRTWQQGDTELLQLQEGQQYMSKLRDEVDIQPLADQGLAWTGIVDGEVIAIGGLVPQWENRAIAWALISKNAGKHFIDIHREAERLFTRSGIRRIEATVDIGFKAGHRWMKMLGFEPEGYMKAYRPDGADQILYARIRRWPGLR